MAFKRITIMDIWEIIRRRQRGQSIKSIACVMKCDRKSIRKYLRALSTQGINLDQALIEKERVLAILQALTLQNQRSAEKRELFEPYLNELVDLVTKTSNRLKLKTAYTVICQRHNLINKSSYSSFKRFVKDHRQELKGVPSTCRIEVDPGSQIQVDYAKVGLLFDPETGKRRVVHAFIGTLSFSRHKYVEIVFHQDQKSFVQSHIKMFNFFGGVPKTIDLDNLKAGVITPSLYDPHFNRSYAEMAEYYKCFLDPCRVRHPKDKPKVERDVQTVREKFRELISINPSITMNDLNTQMRKWLVTTYGLKKHGTTQQEPYRVFIETELPQLLPLPSQQFEPALWKEATVHPDHYIQVCKKSYSVPHPYVGKRVLVKVAANIVQIYYNEQLIKQHTVARGFRQTDIKDFPENLQYALDTGLPLHLQNEAAKIGEHFATLVRSVLTPHAFMNLRRAQGILSIAKTYDPELIERAATTLLPTTSITPKFFKATVEKINKMEKEQTQQLSFCDETRSYVREMNYFEHS